MSDRIRLAWAFRTFLEQAERVGPLGKVIISHRPFREEVERLQALYVSGNISKDLEGQFLQWHSKQQTIIR